MNWFDVLKNPQLVQRQRRVMKPIDIQKPFKRVKEDDKNCYDEFVRIYEKTKNLFPNAKKTEVENDTYEYAYGKTVISLAGGFPPKGEIPDEVFCEAIKLYKNIPLISGAHSDIIKNHYIEAAKNNDLHYIAIWKGDYSKGIAHAYIQIFGDKSLDQNIDGWRGSFI